MTYLEIKKLYLAHSKVLTKLLNNNAFVNELQSRDNLKDVFVEQIRVIKYFESQLTDMNLIQDFVQTGNKKELIQVDKLNNFEALSQKFAHLTHLSIDYDDEHQVISSDEAIDLINYFNVFLKNTVKKSLDEFLKDNPQVQNNSSPNPQQQNNQYSQNNQNDYRDFNRNPQNDSRNTPPPQDYSSYSNPNRSGFFGANPNANNAFNSFFGNLQSESFIQSKAVEILNKEIAEGKYYLFNSRPRIFLYYKFFSGLMTLILSLTLIANLILIFGFTREATVVFIVSANIRSGFGGLISGSGSTFGNLIYIVFVFILVFFTYHLLRVPDNDNLKYSIRRSTKLWGFLAISFLIISYLFSVISIYGPAITQFRADNMNIDTFTTNIQTSANGNAASYGYSSANNIPQIKSEQSAFFIAVAGLSIAILIFAFLT